MQKEINEWLSANPSASLLIVLTDGDIVWDDKRNDFDWAQTTALPVSLRNRFTEEPLWLDLRWSTDNTDLSLRNPKFADAVATLAVAIREVRKSDLIGEEVRQQRRAIRLAAAALVAIFGTTVAWGLAARNAAIQATNAEIETRLALGRSYLAKANGLAPSRGDQAQAFAVEANAVSHTSDARKAMEALAIRHDRLISYLPVNAQFLQLILRSILRHCDREAPLTVTFPMLGSRNRCAALPD